MASEGKELSEALHEAFEKHPELTVKAFDQVIGESAAVNTALRRDLAAANATIAAQSLALATMREALGEFTATSRALRDILDSESEDDPSDDDAAIATNWESLIENMSSMLAQPASDAAALAGSVLEAADQMTEMMALMLGEEDEPDGDGGDVLIRMARARSAYRRARSALRGHGAVEG